MKAIDLQDNFGEYLLDENRKIPKAHLNTVCQLYQKECTCRYIGLSVIGFVCVKRTPMKKTLDRMVKEKKMLVQGDNCEGLGG